MILTIGLKVYQLSKINTLIMARTRTRSTLGEGHEGIKLTTVAAASRSKSSVFATDPGARGPGADASPEDSKLRVHSLRQAVRDSNHWHAAAPCNLQPARGFVGGHGGSLSSRSMHQLLKCIRGRAAAAAAAAAGEFTVTRASASFKLLDSRVPTLHGTGMPSGEH